MASSTVVDDAESQNSAENLKNEEGSSSMSEPDQEEGHLLNDYGDDEALLAEKTTSKSRTRWRKTGSLFIVLAAMVSLIAFFVISLNWSTGRTPDTPKDPNGDYILDPAWDLAAPPARREYHWTIRNTEHNPDGVYRPMILINSQFPGPLIEANRGDTIVVHVDNQGANATAIHWHGLYQNGSNAMDGTVGVTQCPIAPGRRFTYEFEIGAQSGTYYYHAHYSAQASDGTLGPLVIHAQDERELQQVPYATDRVVMVSDHYWDTSHELLMKYLATDGENEEPVPDGALINGRGVRDCSKVPAHRRCDNTSAHVGTPRMFLRKDQGHQLRIVNVGAFAEFQLQIDEHEFAVTEVDGTDVVSAYYHRLNISPGQRYSIVVSANVTGADRFWMRARMVTGCFATENPNLDPEVRAIIQYTSESTTPGDLDDPVSRDWPEVIEVVCRDMDTTELVPAVEIPAPAQADATFYLRSNFEIGAGRLSRGYFNQSSWRPNIQSPTLFQTLDGLSSANASFEPPLDAESKSPAAFINTAAFDRTRSLVIQSPSIAVIDLIITNFDDGNHPMHLHGYQYAVLAQGHGYPPPDLSQVDVFRIPLRRDTASVEAYGWLWLRFVADNPGAWAFHCHVAWHVEAGLLMQFLTRTDDLSKVDGAGRELCEVPRWELEMGGTPGDAVFYGED